MRFPGAVARDAAVDAWLDSRSPELGALARKRQRPNLKIVLIVDPLNEAYGGTHAQYLTELEQGCLEQPRAPMAVEAGRPLRFIRRSPAVAALPGELASSVLHGRQVPSITAVGLTSRQARW